MRYSTIARKRIGVVPGAEIHRRSRLLVALEQAFPVQFEPRDSGMWTGLDAVLLFGAETGEIDHLAAAGISSIHLAADGEGSTAGTLVRFGHDSHIDPLLRRRSLYETTAPARPAVSPEPGDAVLAATTDGAVWLRRERGSGTLHVGASAPEELAPHEPLRERLRDGTFLSLLPLVHFLRDVTADIGWNPPSLRASFIIDDPNLHSPSYGYVRFVDLAREAEECGYHVAMATIPLDAWFVHGETARLFRDKRAQLSLLIHGNNHTRHELARERPRHAIYGDLAQALSRIAALEKKSRLAIPRIIVPPHGRCSEEVMRAMTSFRFEAMCADWPYWWLASPSQGALRGWEPADFLAGNCPVLPRDTFVQPSDDLVFRALLHQPLLVAGHHEDLSQGLERLTSVAERINLLGDVDWISPGAIARSNFAWRRVGSRLHVRLYSRKVRVDIPHDIEELVVEMPQSDANSVGEAVVYRSPDKGVRLGEIDQPVDVSRSPAVDLELVSLESLYVSAMPVHSRSPVWPIIRRLLTEGRDRIRPLVARGGGTLQQDPGREQPIQ